MKEKKIRLLGVLAQKVLLWGLPCLILCAFRLAICLSTLDGILLMQNREMILLCLESISRIMVCLALGTVLADVAERKTKAD